MKTPEKEAATPLLSPIHQDPKTARSNSLRFQGIANRNTKKKRPERFRVGIFGAGAGPVKDLV